jgi:hypothetical protein
MSIDERVKLIMTTAAEEKAIAGFHRSIADVYDPPAVPPVTVPGAGGTVVTPDGFIGRVAADPAIWVPAFEDNLREPFAIFCRIRE